METPGITTITATVLQQTKDTLTEQSLVLDLTIGEILDRIVLDLPIREPSAAVSFLCDKLAIFTREQTQMQLEETLVVLITIFTETLQQFGYSQEEIATLSEECFFNSRIT